MDVEGLASRIVQVPVPEGRYSTLRAVKGGFVWLREPLAGELGEDRGDLAGRRPGPRWTATTWPSAPVRNWSTSSTGTG
nr:hypothetical protein GCM10020093_097610 [Planobispora longispora]